MTLWLVITFIILSTLIIIGRIVLTSTHEGLRIPIIGARGCMVHIMPLLLLALLLSILSFWLSSGR